MQRYSSARSLSVTSHALFSATPPKVASQSLSQLVVIIPAEPGRAGSSIVCGFSRESECRHIVVPGHAKSSTQERWSALPPR